ncbi:MAG: SOS response-associated peptidase [Candidatus Izemoplasmatales bacterium]
MCGRFTLAVTDQAFIKYIGDQFEISITNQKLGLPRYNISPGQEVLSMISDGARYRVGPLHWGFVPPFAKEVSTGYTMINAKSETLEEKVSYLPSFEKKRCVIFADSFYEWKRNESQKQPYRIQKKNQEIFALAGLYTTFTKSDGTKYHSTVIITTEANPLMKDLHDRMPVILDHDKIKIWLDPTIHDTKLLKQYLIPYDDTFMEYYPVSNFVNSSLHESAECIKKME